MFDYNYMLTNTGNETLTGVTLGDDQEPVTCDPTVPVASLAPGESITCTATHTVTQADLDAGSVGNVATGDSEQTLPVTDTVTVPADQSPAMTVAKSATESSFAAVGEVIHYSYVLTNTGNVTLTGVTLVDDKADVSCPGTSLAPGAAMTCTATYTVTQADLDAGSVTNVATGDSEQTESVTDTVTVPATQAPELTVVKSITGGDPFDSVGDVVSYGFVVTNTGNVRLAGPVSVADDQASDESCPALDTVGNGDGFLDPGEQVTCTASYTVTQADLDAGSVTNVASASADGTTSSSDTQTAAATQAPELTVAKSADESSFAAVGEVIHYSYVVTNTGNVTLSGVTLGDDQDPVTCDPAVPVASFAPGATITCSATHEVTQADLDTGSVTNVATGDSDETGPVTDTVTVPGPQQPGMNVEKSATQTSFDTVGEELHYKYLVTNTGNVPLSGIRVEDDRTTVSCPGTSLAPDETMTCTATDTVSQEDVNAGSVTNRATADSAQTSPTTDTVTVQESDSTIAPPQAGNPPPTQPLYGPTSLPNTGGPGNSLVWLGGLSLLLGASLAWFGRDRARRRYIRNTGPRGDAGSGRNAR